MEYAKAAAEEETRLAEQMAHDDNDMQDKVASNARRQRHDARRRERDGRRAEKDRQRKDKEEIEKNKEEAYKAMMEEQHRIEEKQHRREQRRIEAAKREEDKRRKKWEDYEKCLEEQQKKPNVVCLHPFPEEHAKALSEDMEELRSRHQFQSSEEEASNPDTSEEERDAVEPEVHPHTHRHRRRHHHRHAHATDEDSEPREDDIIPVKKDKRHAPGSKKPISETEPRHHHHHHHRLDAGEVPNFEHLAMDNDMNFDVNKDFKLRMKTDDNYEGRNVRFEVNLPDDLAHPQGPGQEPHPQSH